MTRHTPWIAALTIVATVGCASPDRGVELPQDLVKEVRAAMAQEDIARAEAMVAAHRDAHGTTPVGLLALSWLGRGHLAAGDLDQAEAYAQETHDLALLELRQRGVDDEPDLPLALGASIETMAHASAARGARTEAVAYLERARVTYAETSLHKRIQKNIHLLGLAGQEALPLDATETLTRPMPTLDSLRGRVVLLFFWAHWCSDCKRQGPVIERLLERHEASGLTVLAPTQRYGYVAGGVDAPRDEERAYIAGIWETAYPGLHAAGVPVTLDEADHLRYGVSSTPTIVLVDRGGVIRLYNPGQMTEEALEARIGELLAGT
jgi:thiol-disulfide isomerase/thioredoxin